MRRRTFPCAITVGIAGPRSDKDHRARGLAVARGARHARAAQVYCDQRARAPRLTRPTRPTGRKSARGRVDGLQQNTELFYAYRPIDELPDIVQTATAVGATTVWLHAAGDLAPADAARARELVERARFRLRSGADRPSSTQRRFFVRRATSAARLRHPNQDWREARCDAAPVLNSVPRGRGRYIAIEQAAQRQETAALASSWRQRPTRPRSSRTEPRQLHHRWRPSAAKAKT